ncbi:MAG: phasin family protein [Pseudomonadota bacterium]
MADGTNAASIISDDSADAKPAAKTLPERAAPAGAFDVAGCEGLHTDFAEAVSGFGAASLRAAADVHGDTLQFCEKRMAAAVATGQALMTAGTPDQAYRLQADHAVSALEAYAEFMSDAIRRSAAIFSAAGRK